MISISSYINGISYVIDYEIVEDEEEERKKYDEVLKVNLEAILNLYRTLLEAIIIAVKEKKTEVIILLFLSSYFELI